jgi:phosphoglycerate dehydrogenase-like enzyme
MKVALGLPESLQARTKERLAAAMPDATVVPWREADDGDVLLIAPHEYEPEERRELLAARAWSWVHLTSAGTDFVDLPTWPEETVLTRSWRCYAAPLAEYAVAAMVTHEWAGRAPWSSASPARGGLWGAAVGVAGWGAVGRRVAEVCAALGSRVTVLSRTPREGAERIVHTTRRDELLKVDHLVVALPLTDATRNLFDRDFLDEAKPGMHLVNVARADLVDQGRLTALCDRGRLSATLDVADPEPLPADHPLRTSHSVRYSPHTAWSSRDSQYAFVEDFALAARAIERGDPIPGWVRR